MFPEFPPQTSAEWIEGIHKILKGQSIEVLQMPLYEGFSTKPFYTIEDKPENLLQETDFLAFHTCLNVVPIYTTKVEDDLIIAQEWIDKGAEVVCFVFQDEKADVEAYIAQCRMPFGVCLPTDAVGKLDNVQVENEWWLFTESGLPASPTLKRLVQPYRKMLHVDFQAFEEAGANAVQSLAFGFSHIVEVADKLTEAGLSPSEVLGSMRVSVSVGSNYFVEIAKLRAMRVLWRNIVQAYQATFEPLYIHACATSRNKMQEDRYNNLLRNTTEAMAGILGGADSFTTLPYTSPFSFFDDISQEDIIFAKRIARNTLIVLKEEAHLDKVTDAGAGSYYIEWLTKEIAEKAWALFQETEAKGGFTQARAFIDQQITTTAQQRQADFEAGKTILVGVNKYKVKS
jgi:methylmalonyl-CoA mutase